MRDRLERLENGELDVADLNSRERRALLLLLLAKGNTSVSAAARLFKVSRRTIQVDREKIRREVARSTDLDALVGGMIFAADELSTRAADNGDFATAWTIVKQRIELLAELGYLGGRDSGGDLPLTIESLSANYDRARLELAQAFDPAFAAVSGEVIEPERGRHAQGLAHNDAQAAPFTDIEANG
jgi:hypothetical protein